ncbi:cryptochrome DASH, chloroplastic/mitochondrial [Humulus lupulus]|uniref:cryptochrome DASH, chloroplastic/mitochondrial n=1 Tax=Humulus lupulus TaxID=3486 RepID=UPI002B411B17|nr:cryptochrome DASH, chloroplastic/mitochondrial [Humulus lupulus]
MVISLLQLTALSLPSSLNFCRNSHPKLDSTTSILVHFAKSNMMSSGSNPGPVRTSSAKIFKVPDLETEQIDLIADQNFQRYFLSSSTRRRSGNGVAIVWFRNDLRVLDNEALYKAWVSSESVLPVFCVDPRIFGATHYFGFPKTGALRAQFLIECLADLRKNLNKRGLNLMIKHGKPEDILPSLAKTYGAHIVYAQKETCSEELIVERLVCKGLQKVVLQSSSERSNKPGGSTMNPKLQLVWGATMYHIDDLPFSTSSLPDVYTQFRKAVESKCCIRSCIKIPTSLGPPPPSIGDWGSIPSLESLELSSQDVSKGMKFVGGESAALSRVYEYFWKKDLVKKYKETRNGMLGPDYSTKFSPWLASGSLSPRLIHDEVKRYEKERLANDSTYWVLFELIWRDYFRFLSVKFGDALFHLGGPRNVEKRWSQDNKLFESWRDGTTGYPLIDANMKELATSGFMSNRGRQIVCSFLVRDMGIDWRMGAEWFETCLLDYDPCSNYGNWTYGAGVGNDPREDRYFSIPKQAQTYDSEGEYVAYWLPQLRTLPKDKRNFPGKSYIEQIVPLKFGSTTTSRYQGRDMASARKGNFVHRGQRR